MNAILKFLKKNYIRMIVAFVIGLILMAVFNFARGWQSWSDLSSYLNGAFIAGASLFFVGLLVLMAGFGSFDIFSFFIARKVKEDGRKENYTEYVERRREQRTTFNFSFLAYLIIATCFLAFSFVLYFVLPH